jgi:hypothetical protein
MLRVGVECRDHTLDPLAVRNTHDSRFALDGRHDVFSLEAARSSGDVTAANRRNLTGTWWRA